MLKQVKGFPNYSIDEYSNIFNSKGNKIKKFKNVDGYNCVCLYRDGKRKHKRICRLVAEHFVENPENKDTVNHKNFIRDDDYFENLEWVTQKENIRHSIDYNNQSYKGAATVDESQVHEICKLLQDGLRFVDIADILKVGKGCVCSIACGRCWVEISCKYTFPEKHSRVSIPTAKWVLQQIKDGRSYEYILDKTTNKRLTYNLIKLIDDGVAYKELISVPND